MRRDLGCELDSVVTHFYDLKDDRHFVPVLTTCSRRLLPPRLRNALELLSGFDMRDVCVHYDSPWPALLGARGLALPSGNGPHAGVIVGGPMTSVKAQVTRVYANELARCFGSNRVAKSNSMMALRS